ncbi:hypothetical protein F5I97DRAFT_1930922 [Phlebopus sp. FC_14]|nr:hypothetical protein F5I97DRAFT_1930922 [Phlebopus sp. FC_14]
MANDALDINPPAGTRHITTHASDWLWAVFAVMLFSLLLSVLWAGLKRHRNRALHQIPIVVLSVASLAYFSMASDLGFTIVRSPRTGQTRQVWYVRYIQWFINAPLLLLALLAFTGLSAADILTTMFLSWVLVVSGLVGALVPSSYKWGYYAFGLAALFYMWYRLHSHARRFPYRVGHNALRGFHGGAWYITLIWTLYPICWGLSEGSDTISPTSEMVFYGVLDLIAGPLFLLYLLTSMRKLEYAELGATSLIASDRGESERKGAGAGAEERPGEAGTSEPGGAERRA